MQLPFNALFYVFIRRMTDLMLSKASAIIKRKLVHLKVDELNVYPAVTLWYNFLFFMIL